MFSDAATSCIINSMLQFWQLVKKYVKQKNAVPPLKLFNHASQRLYSRTKDWVDGSTQARAILRSSTSSMKWEQNVATQSFKKLSIKAFIAWRMEQKKDFLESKQAFQSLTSHRHALNQVESLADFV